MTTNGVYAPPSRGLLAEVDALVTSCRWCGGVGRFAGSPCPCCALARELRAVVSRYQGAPAGFDWRFGPLRADVHGRSEPTALAEVLTHHQRAALLALVRRAPHPVAFWELAPHLGSASSWTATDSHAVVLLLSRLRPKLHPFGITTVNQLGFGYRLELLAPGGAPYSPKRSDFGMRRQMPTTCSDFTKRRGERRPICGWSTMAEVLGILGAVLLAFMLESFFGTAFGGGG